MIVQDTALQTPGKVLKKETSKPITAAANSKDDKFLRGMRNLVSLCALSLCLIGV